MLKLDVTADVAKATEYLSDVAAKRIPDAAAKALTRTAFDARDAVRDGLPERFNLRRPWISRGIGVTPAKPRTLMAEVWSRDRFMALQESGGTKTGKLAIPVGPMAQTRHWSSPWTMACWSLRPSSPTRTRWRSRRPRW